KIQDIFRRPIGRTIEEVIKVDLADEDIVAQELDEYVATDHIVDSLEEVLDAYQETILKPSELTNLWVSGFFGSGKSSYAKVLGYLLANPMILGRTAADRFTERGGLAKDFCPAEHDSRPGAGSGRLRRSFNRPQRRTRGRERRPSRVPGSP